MIYRPQDEHGQRHRAVHGGASHDGGRPASAARAEAAHPADLRQPRPQRPRADADAPAAHAHQAHAHPARQHHPHGLHHPRHATHEREPEPERHKRHPAAAPRRTAPRRYALSIAGQQVRFGPVVFWTVVGTLVIMACWSIVTATYFAFHDDVITRMITRQVDLQAAYEDRLADMRAQVDRVVTRQLLDQEQFANKLEQAARRQSMLEQRASAIGALADPSVTGATKPGGRATSGETAGSPPKPSPIRDNAIPGAPRDRHSRLDPGAPPASAADAPDADARLARLSAALDRMEQRQAAALVKMEEQYDGTARRIRAALAELGLNTGKVVESGVGGPYVPLKGAAGAGGFERQIQRIQSARAQLERLHKTLVAVPLRRPVSGEIDMSSTFGMRIDPFVGRPAMHTGIDFRGDVGEAVRATAIGTVASAGWSGGYGKMVEIDHGNGFATRYGHLSEIVVQVGEKVRLGQVVGRMGSTGRSTGPHLHYETRTDGEAVDPQRFLRAGDRLGAL